MTLPIPARRAEELLAGEFHGPVQATPWGVLRARGYGRGRRIRLEVRPDPLPRRPHTRFNGLLEADGFQSRLVGRLHRSPFADPGQATYLQIWLTDYLSL